MENTETEKGATMNTETRIQETPAEIAWPKVADDALGAIVIIAIVYILFR